MSEYPSTRDVFELEAHLETLRTELRGEILLPADDDYDVVRSVWNGMIDRKPSVIARCTGTRDVVATVDFAREHDLAVSIHGGGHNVAGNAVSDGGLMIDLSRMNGVRVDREDRTVRVEGGAVLGDVDHETQLFGLATPLGAVSETGVAGLTLNGGYGHLSREHGLACDNLTEVDIVTADGEVRTASEDRNEDLFWAIRGGGGNFGVVTSFEYDLHEVGPEVYATFVWYHADDAAMWLDRFRDWADSAPRTAGVLPFTAHVPELDEFPEESWGEPALAFLGSYRGDLDEATDVYAPLLDTERAIADFSGRTSFEDLQAMLDEDYPDGMRYYWKSTYLTELSDEVVDVVRRYNEEAPSTLSTIDIWSLGGAVSDVPQEATAFWHRDKPFMVNFEANWEDPDDDDENVQWAREGLAELEELPVAAGRYGNFPGLGEDPTTALFGDNYDRLVDVKIKYDPENRFRFNQNVAPRSGSD
ncbi:FAD/FMN-containing dehydrogenase [Halomicrobium zhouii]|uniref:FAD/FMN-containing dehydrogenase n=2 Tax=Halomicrobium zhouii TaxID=767519 RepID=A0A1I6L2L9_9EURY|nr:FAD-binding oxidoreductase [Halomicrobium zhouii]SFR97705.1 FAD/FMN-containing dehydrogenase [Halomicrobium zhouii]